MITLKDLAQKLNISISTVSKALNNSDEISDATIKRVKKAAKIYKYRPNKLALNLKKNRTETIGVIIPNILNHFFAKTLYSIEKEATKKGYNIITCISNESYKSEVNSLEILANGSVDGFIMSLSEETQRKNKLSHIQDIIDQGIPIVLFDRVSNAIECDKVVIDDIKATYLATKKLLKEGRKTIVLVSNIDELSVGKLRLQGYLDALKEDDNYSTEPIHIHITKAVGIEESIENLFEECKHVDGIVAIDNISGVVALNKAKDLGYNIPKDLSIIGFSDDNVLYFTNPKLTTIAQDANAIGSTSVKLLLQRVKGEEEEVNHKTKIIKTPLLERGTTK